MSVSKAKWALVSICATQAVAMLVVAVYGALGVIVDATSEDGSFDGVVGFFGAVGLVLGLVSACILASVAIGIARESKIAIAGLAVLDGLFAAVVYLNGAMDQAPTALVLAILLGTSILASYLLLSDRNHLSSPIG